MGKAQSAVRVIQGDCGAPSWCPSAGGEENLSVNNGVLTRYLWAIAHARLRPWAWQVTTLAYSSRTLCRSWAPAARAPPRAQLDSVAFRLLVALLLPLLESLGRSLCGRRLEPRLPKLEIGTINSLAVGMRRILQRRARHISCSSQSGLFASSLGSRLGNGRLRVESAGRCLHHQTRDGVRWLPCGRCLGCGTR